MGKTEQWSYFLYSNMTIMVNFLTDGQKWKKHFMKKWVVHFFLDKNWLLCFILRAYRNVYIIFEYLNNN